MATLHLLSAAPGARAVESCLALAVEGDSLLCFGDGVYNLLGRHYDQLREVCLPVYVLGEDADARGLGDRLPGGVETIDYSMWVALSESHERSASWF